MSLWRLEWLRLMRTKRFLIIAGVYMLFGVLGPLTARYLPEILERYGGGLEVVVPDPIPADGITQFNANAQQLGILAVVAVAGAALAFDANREMSIFLRTRATVTNIVRPRYVVNALGALVALLLGAGLALTGTWILLGSIPLDSFTVGIALNALYLAFAVAVTALAASIVRTVPLTVLVTIGFLIVLGILSIVPQVSEWLPSALPGSLDELIRGAPFDYWPAVAITGAATVLCLGLSVYFFRGREV